MPDQNMQSPIRHPSVSFRMQHFPIIIEYGNIVYLVPVICDKLEFYEVKVCWFKDGLGHGDQFLHRAVAPGIIQGPVFTYYVPVA